MEVDGGYLLVLVTTVGGRTSLASMPKVTILRVVPSDNCWMNLERDRSGQVRLHLVTSFQKRRRRKGEVGE